MISVSFCYLFQTINKWMERSKHGFFLFPPKKTLIWRRHSSITQSCCSMTWKRSIDWYLESSREWSFFTGAFAWPTKSHVRLCPFVCCFCFVRAFSFQGHTKIALIQHWKQIIMTQLDYKRWIRRRGVCSITSRCSGNEPALVSSRGGTRSNPRGWRKSNLVWRKGMGKTRLQTRLKINGIVPNFCALWTPIRPVAEVKKKKRGLEPTERKVNI